MATGLQEGEIKQAIAEGGHVRSVVVISTCICTHSEHLAYLLPSWKRDLLPLRTWNNKSDRTYRDLDRLFMLLRTDFAFRGVIPVYLMGDPELAKYKVLAQGQAFLGCTHGPLAPRAPDKTQPSNQ